MAIEFGMSDTLGPVQYAGHRFGRAFRRIAAAGSTVTHVSGMDRWVWLAALDDFRNWFGLGLEARERT